MKKSLLQIATAICALVVFSQCNNTPAEKEPVAAKADSTASWKLGVQMWTFHEFPFVTALEKADSAGVKFIEAFPGQPMGGDFNDTFGIHLSAENRTKLKNLLQSKGITMVAFGVVVPQTVDEWKQFFELGKEMGVQYITAEPLDEHWDAVDSLAGIYGINIAIHDHPRPSHYWHPDSVLAAAQGHPHLGSCADLGHWARSGLDPVQCLQKLDGKIFGVHFKDVAQFDNTGAEDVITGTGVIKFDDVFAELKKQHFNGMFSIERENNWQNNMPDVKTEKAFFEKEVGAMK